MSKVHIPDVHIQDSAGSVFEDIYAGIVKSERIWLEIDGSYTHLDIDSNGVHALTPSTKGTYKKIQHQLILEQGKNQFVFDFPTRKPLTLLGGKVTCGDTDGSGNIIVGDNDGRLAAFNGKGEPTMSFEGHALHTYVAKYFPSSEVALSSGMDFTIKIWDVRTGELAQSLRHQKGSVTDVALVDRGRNILSLCKNDNSVALWEVGAAQVLHEFSFNAPSAISLASHGAPRGDDLPDEYGTSGKNLAIAGDEGVKLYDLRSRASVGSASEKSSTAVAMEGHLLAHSDSDNTYITDIRAGLGSVLTTVDAPASQLVLYNSVTALITNNGEKVVTVDKNNAVAIKTTSLKTNMITFSTGLWSFGDTVRSFSR